jgi:tetratricopeptide (TPR) repeat protein
MKQLFVILIAVMFVVTSTLASTAADLISSGNALWSEGRLDEAEVKFRQALASDPESSKASERLASLYLTQNKTTEAITAYQEAITLDPENANLFIGIAIAYLHKQYYRMAEAMVNHAMELNPELAYGHKLQQYLELKMQVQTEGHHTGGAAAASVGSARGNEVSQD